MVGPRASGWAGAGACEARAHATLLPASLSRRRPRPSPGRKRWATPVSPVDLRARVAALDEAVGLGAPERLDDGVLAPAHEVVQRAHGGSRCPASTRSWRSPVPPARASRRCSTPSPTRTWLGPGRHAGPPPGNRSPSLVRDRRAGRRRRPPGLARRPTRPARVDEPGAAVPRQPAWCCSTCPTTTRSSTEHRAIAERLYDRVDLLVWVVDPQKYADAALHTRYLRPTARTTRASSSSCSTRWTGSRRSSSGPC